MKRNIKDALYDWGKWAQCKIGTEYPSVAAGMFACTKWEHSLLSCGDEEGEIIDRAVCRLRSYDEMGYILIIAHYVYNASFRKIGRISKKPHQYISDHIARAESVIAGQLLLLMELKPK